MRIKEKIPAHVLPFLRRFRFISARVHVLFAAGWVCKVYRGCRCLVWHSVTALSSHVCPSRRTTVGSCLLLQPSCEHNTTISNSRYRLNKIVNWKQLWIKEAVINWKENRENNILFCVYFSSLNLAYCSFSPCLLFSPKKLSNVTNYLFLEFVELGFLVVVVVPLWQGVSLWVSRSWSL